jgi:hypothetical protein
MHIKKTIASVMELLAVCGLGLLPAVSSSRAQERTVGQGQPAPVATATAVTSDGTSFTYVPFAGAEAGYDSNLDNRFKEKGSRFEMLQAGASFAYRLSDDAAYAFFFRGRDYSFDDLKEKHRYDIDVNGGARYDLSKNTVFKVGGSFYRDGISLTSIDVIGGFADLVHEEKDYRLRVKAVSRNEISVDGDGPIGALDPEVFDVTRNRAFDFTKNGVTVSMLAFPKAFIAPFVIGNYTNIDFFHQSGNPSINRNANEVWGVAGIRLNIASGMTLDLGARFNRRDFADDETTSFQSVYFDSRFSWKVTSDLTVRGIVEREIKEPSTVFGLADDVTTYEVAFDQKLGAFTIFGRTFLDHVKPIGDNFDFFKFNWSAGVRYDVDDRIELYGEYFGKLVEEDVRDDAYDRDRISAGVRVKF